MSGLTYFLYKFTGKVRSPGSILGPLWFLTYINDFNNKFNVLMYAETTLYANLESEGNKLSLNVNKLNLWYSGREKV